MEVTAGDADNLNKVINYHSLSILPPRTPIFLVIDDDKCHIPTLPLPAVVTVDVRPQLPVETSFEEILFLHENIIKSLEECYDLEYKTRTQADCSLWHEARSYRLTSSNFYRIFGRKTDFNSLSHQLKSPKCIDNIPAVSYGKKTEVIVKRIIESSNDLYFRDVGLVVNPAFPYLAASPDGLLYKTNFDPLLVEIKCIFNEKNLPLTTLCSRANFCLKFDENFSFSLKTSHPYYFQVQGQMGITNIKKCLFVVYFSASEAPYQEIVEFATL